MVRTFFTDMRATLDFGTAVLFFAALVAVRYGGLSLFLPSGDRQPPPRGRPAGAEKGGEEADDPIAALAAWAALAGWTVLLLWLTYTFRKPLFGLFEFAFG